jgi:plastocyanin
MDTLGDPHMSRITHRALLASVFAVVALTAGACGGGGGGGGGDASGAEGGVEAADIGPADITIVNCTYEPLEFTAEVGQEIVWINEGAAPHTVTGEDFDSGTIKSGMGWTHTFDEPGTYEVHCTIHEDGVVGTITVE